MLRNKLIILVRYLIQEWWYRFDTNNRKLIIYPDTSMESNKNDAISKRF